MCIADARNSCSCRISMIKKKRPALDVMRPSAAVNIQNSYLTDIISLDNDIKPSSDKFCVEGRADSEHYTYNFLPAHFLIRRYMSWRTRCASVHLVVKCDLENRGWTFAFIDDWSATQTRPLPASPTQYQSMVRLVAPTIDLFHQAPRGNLAKGLA